MPCVLPDAVRQNVTQIELFSMAPPKNWHEWNLRITDHINAVNEFVKLFPASHSFASLPCSLSVILTQINRVVKEQSKLENLLEVLTSGQEGHDYSSVFGMDVVLIKQQLKPVPIHVGEEDESWDFYPGNLFAYTSPWNRYSSLVRKRYLPLLQKITDTETLNMKLNRLANSYRY